VKGLSSNNAWLIKRKPEHLNLFYILVRVGDVRGQDRFFILDQPQLNSLLQQSRLAHPNDPTKDFGWNYPMPSKISGTFCRDSFQTELMRAAENR
jgi:hypothetical protein